MAVAVESLPTSAPKPESDLKNIAVRREDAAESDRIFGKAGSYADRFHAMLETIKRNRKVEEVRRRILGVEEAIGEFADAVASTERRIIRDSKQRDAASGRVEPRHRVR